MTLKIINDKKLLENFLSLIVLNVVNYIFPIIIIPILILRLGVEIYGKYIFAFTILSYLSSVVQYGFNFSATNKIAKNQNNKNIISDTYTSVTIIRIIFSVFFVVGLFILLPFFKDLIPIYLFGIGIFLGQGLIPIWLFQGLEKMKYITIINALIRSFSFLLIIVFIKNKNDLNMLMSVQSLSFIIGSIISFFLVKYQLKVYLVIPKRSSLYENLREGWSMFLSTIGMNMYRESNIVILGLVSGYSVLGLYSPAEKLIKGIQSFTNTIVTALYPHFSKKIAIDECTGKIEFFKLGRLLALVFLIVSLVVFFSASYIIRLYLGKGFLSTIVDLRILSLIIFLGGLNYYYGIVGMVNFGMQTLFNRLVWLSGLVGMFSSLVLSYYFKDIGASVAMCFAELVLLFFITKNLKK